MDKMQLAHDYAVKLISDYGFEYIHENHKTMLDFVESAWKYADAMQAEADKRKVGGLPDALREGWQPDWSQAPDYDVQYFSVDENGRGGWYVSKPDLYHDHWYWSGHGERKDCYDNAPSFNYKGDWQNSLRKRPD